MVYIPQGAQSRQVVVDEIVRARVSAMCIVPGTSGEKMEVDLLPLRTRMPQVGETWIIDKVYTGWTFSALVNSPYLFPPLPFTPYPTASRPSAVGAAVGGTYYDTTKHKPCWSDGTVWRDATGTAVV